MNDALLVIDVQCALLAELAKERRAELLATLTAALERARSRRIPIVFVRHDGSPHELIPGSSDWQIAEQIAPLPGEAVIDKRHAEAFEGTLLAATLETLAVGGLYVAGMQSDVCVDATIREAHRRGYRVTLIEDAHATSASGGRSETDIHAEIHREAQERGTSLARAHDIF